MKIFNENDVVKVNKNLIGISISESLEITIPEYSIATIVHIYGNNAQPDAYEIEVYIPSTEQYVLATVKPTDLVDIK
jgi:hypothetical protein